MVKLLVNFICGFAFIWLCYVFFWNLIPAGIRHYKEITRIKRKADSEIEKIQKEK